MKDFGCHRHKLSNGRWAMNNDEASFRGIYREFLGPIRAYLARRVPFDDVEDLAADVFAVAWKKRASVNEGEELPWLYRIASFVVANYRRKERHRFDLLWLFHEPDTSPAADVLAESDPDLASAWATLSVGQRELLALVVVDGVPVNEAARVLGVSPNAVSIRLHRAKKLLADRLSTLHDERLTQQRT
jgi:RNA polymerase sigma-70 factor, ECF subfamily